MKKWQRNGQIGLVLLALAAAYLFQREWAAWFGLTDGDLSKSFSSNLGGLIGCKYSRYLWNDLWCMILINTLFPSKTAWKSALYLMLFGLFVLIPLYFILLASKVDYLQNWLSHLHRITVNPVLMFLLIPALWLQEKLSS